MEFLSHIRVRMAVVMLMLLYMALAFVLSAPIARAQNASVMPGARVYGPCTNIKQPYDGELCYSLQNRALYQWGTAANGWFIMSVPTPTLSPTPTTTTSPTQTATATPT